MTCGWIRQDCVISFGAVELQPPASDLPALCAKRFNVRRSAGPGGALWAHHRESGGAPPCRDGTISGYRPQEHSSIRLG